MGRRAEDGGRSECPPVAGGIGVESSGEITPPKAGQLPSGLSSRENLANHFRGQADDGRHSHCWCGLPRGGRLASINWKSAYRIVCRLQARIVKAIQEGRWGKVKALQYLLTHSFSGKALAIRRVTENQGKGTPGVDREVWDTPEKKATALQAATTEGLQSPTVKARVHT